MLPWVQAAPALRVSVLGCRGHMGSGRGPCRPVVALGVDGTTCPQGAGPGDSGQEESPKGCTGEKDQVHPGRPERGDVKWGTQVTVIRAPNEREQPRGALLPGGLELERRHF